VGGGRRSGDRERLVEKTLGTSGPRITSERAAEHPLKTGGTIPNSSGGKKIWTSSTSTDAYGERCTRGKIGTGKGVTSNRNYSATLSDKSKWKSDGDNKDTPKGGKSKKKPSGTRD